MKSIENLIVTTILLLSIFFCLMHLQGCRPSEKIVSDSNATTQSERRSIFALDSAFRSFKFNADSLDCWMFFDSYIPVVDTSAPVQDSPISVPNVPCPSQLSTPHLQAVHLTAKNANVEDDAGHKVEVCGSTSKHNEVKKNREVVQKKPPNYRILIACFFIIVIGVLLLLYRLKARR